MTNRKSGAAAGPPRAAARPHHNAAESPLTWLHSRRRKDGKPLISDAELAAGERLRRDFEAAQMTPRLTVDWRGFGRGRGGRAGPSDLADGAAAAGERVRRALAAVGPDLSGVLLDVCCHLIGLEGVERRAGWPQRSGKIVLRIALERLASHYGLLGAVQADGGVRIRHWAGDGYRPEMVPD